ncbi:MAG: NAD-dependent epimerase/dehydratase family protein [Planctomycetota bacterium]|nr:MAG: NAD-dependent epimerase/dehydratase family protein [Planctomycetota bacterium]
MRRFVLVSTIYVCGTRTGDIPEAPLPEPPAFHNDYERSKWTAEQLVRGWASEGGTATIVRPAILIGDRTRGRSTRFNGIYVIARAAEILRRAADGDPRTDRHRIPLRLPGRGEATCQMVPVDWAAERLAEIATNPKARGLVHHLTNPDPPTHADVKAWLESYFDIGGGRFVEGCWPLKDPNPFEEAFYSLGQVVRDYFRSGLTFADRFHESGPRRGLVDRASFFRCLHYAQAHNWGRSPVEQPVPSSHRWVDPEWYFEDFLPRTIPTSSVARTHGLTTTVRFHIRPPDHVWVCRFRAGKLLSVHPANGEGESEFGYRVTGDAFSRIVTGQEPVQAAFFRGEAQIDGNVERALQMVPIMTQFLHEHPVRHAPTA